jgi:hypothetical protein
MTLPSIRRFCSHLALASVLIATEARSQDARDTSRLDIQWHAVQALSSGELVEVRLLKKGSVSGRIAASTEMGLTVTANDGHVTNIARSDIRELKARTKRRLRSHVFGAAIGATSGIVLAVILDGALTDGNGISGKYAALLGAICAGIGFITTLEPTYSTIYKIR